MPEMNGFEATKEIRLFDKKTPIVGLSADVITGSELDFVEMGMNDFVSKPIIPANLIPVLRRLIG